MTELDERKEDNIDDRSMEFLLQDQAQKVSYLNDQFGRMWTRFNFFISIETGLLGFMLLSGGSRWSDKALFFVLAGIVLSILWWVFAAEDRALVQYYRGSIKTATCRITDNLPRKDIGKMDYDCAVHYVGNRNEWQKPDGFNPVEWYSPRISITRLAAYFALVTIFLWLGLALLVPIPSEFVCSRVSCIEVDGRLVPEANTEPLEESEESNGRTQYEVIPGAQVDWEITLQTIRNGLVLLLMLVDVGLILLAYWRSDPDREQTSAETAQEGQGR